MSRTGICAARPQVALVIQDPNLPLRHIQIRGRVVEITVEGALEHINMLSLKYDGKPWIPRADQIRLSYKILPESVFADE